MMHDTLRNPSSHMRRRAQIEIELMSMLRNRPMSCKELSAALDMNPRTVKSIMNDLVSAQAIRKLPPTHKVELMPA